MFASQKLPFKKTSEPVARNVMESGYTEKYVILQTRLTEPQGKLKRLEPVARNVMEGGYTKEYVILQTRLTEPQGKLKI